MGSVVQRRWVARGRRLGSRRIVRVLDLSTDRVVSTIRVPRAIDTALSPDGKRVAVARWWPGGEVGAVFDVSTGEKRSLSRGPTVARSTFPGVSWSPDGRLVAASSEGTARVWDAETGTVRHALGHTGFVLSVAWSPDSSRLVTGGSDGTAKVWEIGSDGVRERWSLSAQETKSGIVGVAFSPDGTRVMAGMRASPRCRSGTWGRPATPSGRTCRRRAIRRRSSCRTDGVVTSSWAGRPDRAGGSRGDDLGLQAGRDLRTIGPATDYFAFHPSL